MNQFADQVGQLARRSIVRTVRQPANVVAPLVFPLLLLAVNSGGLKAETNLPGFPTRSFVAFALAVPFIQGALFSTMNAGTDLARDIQTGFLNRLSLTPMRRLAVLAGQLGGAVTMGLVQAVVYLSVGLIAGVRIAAGPAGVVLLLAFAVLVALGFGALGAFAALRTGSGEAVQSLFPAFFVFLFISSMNIPRNLIEHGWFRDLATANPVSYLLECVRSVIITGWDGQALGLGFGIAAAITVTKLSGFATSSGSVVFAWPWKPTNILCLSANGARRFAMLTWVEVEIAFTPSHFAIMKAYSISSSFVLRTFMLKQSSRRSMPASAIFLRTGVNVAADAAMRQSCNAFAAASRAAPTSSSWTTSTAARSRGISFRPSRRVSRRSGARGSSPAIPWWISG